jgi:hypothetical protein
MAIILQSETSNVENANSYISVEETISYFSIRGVDLTDFDGEDVEFACIKATDYIDLVDDYKSSILDEDQETQWPRKGYGIPVNIKKAAFEYAKIILVDGQELSPNLEYTDNGQNIKSEKVKIGPIEETITYKDDYKNNVSRSYAKADGYLKRYRSTSSSSYLIGR